MAKNSNRIQLSRTWWHRGITVLCILALVLSAILSWHFLTGRSMAGCSGGSACDNVLSSRWSMLADILPVSGLAMGVYLAMLFASLFISRKTELPIRRLAWKVLLVLTGSVAGSAVWFTIIQKWIIGEFCLYCMAAHITGLIITALVFWRAVKEPESDSTGYVSMPTKASIIRPWHATGLVMIGLVIAGTLALSQVVLAPSVVYLDGKSQEKMSAVNYHDVPIVGSPDAPIVMTLLFDYECSHCQKIHFMLNEAVKRYNGKLAFALCPTPLNTRCNPYIPRDVDTFKNSCELAKIGLSVWIANREAFPVFENWMFTYETGDRWHPRSPDAARAKAIELVGESGFTAAWSDPWIESYLQNCVQIFGQTLQGGKGGIPKLIYGSHWVIPEPNNADDLIRILQESLALPQP